MSEHVSEEQEKAENVKNTSAGVVRPIRKRTQASRKYEKYEEGSGKIRKKNIIKRMMGRE